MALLHRNALQGTKEFEASEIDKTNHSIEIINSGKKDRSWLEINKYMVMLEYLFICAYVFIIYFK